jgi:hypothetical protein
VLLIKKFKNTFLNFLDITYDPNNSTSFVRVINDSLFVYDNGIRKLSLKRKKAKYFSTLKRCKALTQNFITMDLETKTIKGSLVPYCVSIYDGKTPKYFYITDYNSSDEMLKYTILFNLKRKYNKYRIYLHNFSYFDGIFLMKIISNIVSSNNIKPVIKDGRIINFKVEFGSPKKINLKF